MRRYPDPVILIFFFALVFIPQTSYGYNYPWSNKEDITKNNPENATGECGECQCTGEPAKDCQTASPVYMKTGHLVWDETDVVLPGKPSLGLRRSYTSHDSRSGLFGNGWISGVERALIKTVKTIDREDGTGTYKEVRYIFRHPDGLRYTFKELEDGSLESPKGLFNTIEKLPDGSYRFAYKDGTVETYEDGNIILRKDSNGNSLIFTYDENGLLQRVENSGASSLSFHYGANGYVETIEDHSGRRWNYSYDSNGNLTAVIDPLGGVRSFSYQSYKPSTDAQIYYQLTNITDPSGVAVINVVYSGERVSSYSMGENIFSYSFNFSSRSAVKTDSVGSNYGFDWDPNGLLVRRVDPMGESMVLERNDDLVITARVDRGGNRWQKTVDERGRTLSSTSPLGQTTSYQYNPDNDNPYPTRIISPLGYTTAIGYDASYNIRTITNALGDTTQLSVDSQGNITSITDALDQTTTAVYNIDSRPISVTDPLGRTSAYSYDDLGRVITATDAEGRTSSFEYDLLSRLIRSTNPLGHNVAYSYDAAGRLLSLTDPAGNTTEYLYDSYGRLAQETRPDGGITLYSYNSDNTLSSVVRPDSTTITLRYDAAKRLTQENVGGDIRSYSYDARGHLISAVNSNGQVELSYDAAGRLVSEIQNGLAVSSSYDQDNNRIGLSYADESLSLSRNGLGLAQSITSSLNGESYNFTYDANGILLATLLPNGLANSMSYNQGYDLSAITAGLSSLVYSHDATGLITNKTIDGASTSYSYDDGRRLISAGATNFSYDVAGNILKDNAAFDIVNNRISEDSNTFYSYDAAGNLREKQSKLDNSKKLYSWNSRNELISVESFDGENNSLYRMAFSYGPLGRRLTKTVDTITDTYLYDGPDIVAILDTDQGVISTLVHGDSIDTPLSISTYDSTYYYHRDHQGSILSLTSSNQSEVESLSYDAYGQTIFSQSETTNNPYGYTGREFDDADLYYYRARYYDPSIGRFLSEDPIGFYSGDFNFYRYVQNDPINYIDPEGFSRWYPVPGKKRWEVRRDQPHHPKDYRHDHYRHKGKEVPRKVNPETGEQKEHGKGKCTGDDEDVPQDVIDAANQAFSVTGNVGFDLGLLEGMEAINDTLDALNDALPPPPIIPIPGFLGVPIGVPAIP